MRLGQLKILESVLLNALMDVIPALKEPFQSARNGNPLEPTSTKALLTLKDGLLVDQQPKLLIVQESFWSEVLACSEEVQLSLKLSPT